MYKHNKHNTHHHRWVIASYAPSGECWFEVMLNSYIHVVMYSYYLLASMVGKDPRVRAKWLWWGKYLTQMQMAQFVSMLVHSIFCYTSSPYPKALGALLCVYMVTLLALFLDFYIRKHVLKGKKGDGKGKKAQ